LAHPRISNKINVIILVFAILICLLAVEVVMRFLKPSETFGGARELKWMRDMGRGDAYEIDPSFGFKPVFGKGEYGEYGTKVNNYQLQKRQGITRLLFVGDSVTRRKKIIDHLRQLYGEDKFEYWNAGVESFNTLQEVDYYKEYNAQIKPDHVILTFHLNDFETTPVIFKNKEDNLVVYSPYCAERHVNPFLFRHSYLYRLFIKLFIEFKGREESIEEIEDDVRKGLSELRDVLKKDGIDFSVVVIPFLKPFSEWSEIEMRFGDKIIRILNDLGITYYSLFPILEKALKDKIFISDDTWHPSDEMGRYCAEYLYKRKMLGE